MNKIFKVVWNKARNCYVVASEFAKSRTKSGRAVKGAALAAAVALADTAENRDGDGQGVAIGENSNAEHDNDTAIGKEARADGETTGLSTAIGYRAKALKDSSTAVGAGAQATDENSTAVGRQANASGENSTAIGVAVQATAENSTALGVGSRALSKNSTALGNADVVENNVAAGTADTDAVNVSQLKQVEQSITNNSVQINKLGSRIDKVGAGAAALAALHPLDFDPDDKFYLSAGYGHYRGENAVAVGAFYQPNDDTLFSISSTVGNDDDMINAGVTWRFGQSSHQSRSKKAMAKEIIELRTEVAELKAMVYSLTGYGLDLEKSKLFPDTPENHWAYDYVAVVAGNGILEGYPDGYFDGDRPMTRYEMAAVVYRLLQKGVQVDNRMIQEFAPELARVRVDTLTHYGDGTPHIQRVRVIKGRG